MTQASHSSDEGCCLVCGEGRLAAVAGFGNLLRITSDCRPFRAGGELYVCNACGAVQKRVTAQWLEDISRIYAAYESYYQSGGDEQIVFDTATGRPRRRSDVVMDRLLAVHVLPDRGVALDVGCGNGVTLSSMSAALPEWSLDGFEMGDGALNRLQRIPRFGRLHTKSLEGIGRRFDLVTMVHSLEHFPGPLETLRTVRELADGGRLFVEVCNVEENPFDVLVADHLMHFSPSTLATLVRRAGFKVSLAATDWVPKEISLLAVPGHEAGEVTPPGIGEQVHARVSGYVNWLSSVVLLGQRLASDARPFGLFGTSIAATWLAAQLGEAVAFFVDEDESRVGRQHLGRPICRPADVEVGFPVYLSLAPTIANQIATRLAPLGLDFVMPPALAGTARAAGTPTEKA